MTVPDVLREATAAAVLAVMKQHRPSRIRRDEFRDREYEECQQGCRYEVGGCYEHQSKLAADAVLAALGLQQEWGVLSDKEAEPHQVFDFRAPAQQTADWRNEHDIPATVVSRFVGPWRAAE